MPNRRRGRVLGTRSMRGPERSASGPRRRSAGTIWGAAACALVVAAGSVAAAAPATAANAQAPASVAGLPLAPIAPEAAEGPTATGVATAVTQATTPAAIDAKLGPDTSKALSGNYAVVVADEQNVLLAKNLDKPMIPGSTAKLVTAASVLNAVGPDHRLVTRAVLQGNTIVLVGGGDPQLSNRRSPKSDPLPNASLQQLAQQTAAALQQVRSGQASASGSASGPASGNGPYTVAYDTSLFTGPTSVPLWDEDLQNRLIGPVSALTMDGGTRLEGEWRSASPSPAVDAATAFSSWLTKFGVPVQGSPVQGLADPADSTLASVQSQPMAVLVEHMLINSDNIEAEMLGRVAGAVLAGDASFVGAQEAARATLSELGIPLTGFGLEDSSGMSKGNRLSASLLLNLLAAVEVNKQPYLWPIASGLPSGGFDGTLAPRFAKPATVDGRGVVRAKTGTLTGVSSLAGWVFTAGGQPLRFVMNINDSKAFGAAAIEDLVAATLAGCGCGGPSAPLSRPGQAVPSASATVDERPETAASGESAVTQIPDDSSPAPQGSRSVEPTPSGTN